MADRLTEALLELRRESGGPGAEVLLSNVGFWLVRRGIQPSTLPGGRLGEFFASMPDYAIVSGNFVRFGGGHPDFHLVAGAAPLRIRRELWDAWVDTDPKRVWSLDLTTFALVASGPADKQPPARDVELIRIPTISIAEQRGHARTTLAGHVEPGLLEAALSAEPWPTATTQALPTEARQRLRNARTKWVVEQAVEWLEQHRIPPRMFAFSPRAHGEASTGRPPSSPPSTQEEGPERDLRDRRQRELRTALHRTIECMTLAELAELRIPARFLIGG